VTVRKSKYSWDKCFGNWVCSTMQNVVANPAKGWEILVTYTKKPHQIERGCLDIREDQPKIRHVYRGVLLRFDLWHNWRWAFPATVWCFRGSQTLNTNTSCVKFPASYGKWNEVYNFGSKLQMVYSSPNTSQLPPRFFRVTFWGVLSDLFKG